LRAPCEFSGPAENSLRRRVSGGDSGLVPASMSSSRAGARPESPPATTDAAASSL